MGIGELSVAEFTAFNTEWLTQAVAFSRPGAIHWAFMAGGTWARCSTPDAPPGSSLVCPQESGPP
jgi:hypothetical protein